MIHNAPNLVRDTVKQERVDDLLVLEVDNLPANGLSQSVCEELLAALDTLRTDATLTTAVLIGAGNKFCAGVDACESGTLLDLTFVTAVQAAIENCGKTVVAALGGAVLGAGFELSLACDARIALASTVLCLPEVTLGLIPGAGGAQRVPRMVGVARAIALICGGGRTSAHEALELGLVDAVVIDQLKSAAIAKARSLGQQKRRIRDLAVPSEDAALIDRAEQSALRTGKRRPPVVAAIKAIKNAMHLPIDEALRQERAACEELRAGKDALALRYQLFAERQAMDLPAELLAAPRAVQIVAIIGAGTMGAGIAISALDAGLDVILLEQTADALQRGHQRVVVHYQGRVAAGKLDAVVAGASQDRLHLSTNWADLGRADLVIEAVFEDMAVKQEVFKQIDVHARAGAVLATNTSYLDVDAIANVTGRSQDVVGLHFFSPANVMKLLEVVRASRSAPDVLATGMAFGKMLRKMPVLSGNAFGFIGNRIYNAYRKQCEFMLEDGAWPEDVDKALQEFGFAMGPFAVADLSGLDIAWRMRKAQAATRDGRERYVAVLDQVCEQGRLGRKTGAGYYRYDDGRQATMTDDAVRAIITEASLKRGIVRRTLSATEIVRRALLAMVNEAALLLAEGVASRASDIDVVLVQGYGFPRWEGGPVFWARQQDRAALLRELQALAVESGHGFVLADLGPLLLK